MHFVVHKYFWNCLESSQIFIFLKLLQFELQIFVILYGDTPYAKIVVLDMI